MLNPFFPQGGVIYPTLRRDVDGLIATARLQWFLGRIGLLGQDSTPDQAAALHLDLMRFCAGQAVGEQAWREVLRGGLGAAVGAEDVAFLDEFFGHYLWLGWSGKSAQQTPYALLLELLEAVEEARAWPRGVHLGDLIQQAYPALAIGPYATAHCRESGNPRPGHAMSRRIVRDFERAHALALRQGDEAFAKHIELREHIHRIRHAVGAKEALRAIKGAKASQMPPAMRFWYAQGMVHSGFWLDRVRALDVLDDLARDAMALRPSFAGQGVSVQELEALADRLVRQVGAGSLPQTEEDRLLALLETLHGGEGQQVALAKERLEQGRLVEAGVTVEWEAFEGLPGHTAYWVDRQFFLRVVQGMLGHEEGACGRARALIEGGDLLCYESHVLRVFVAINEEDVEAYARAFEAVNQTWGGAVEGSVDVLGVVWPEALRGLARWAPSKAERRAHLEAPKPEHVAWDRAAAALGAALVGWSKHQVREPSYGMWPLIRHVIEAKLVQTAHQMAKPLVRQGWRPPQALRGEVYGALLDWALRHGPQDEVRFWLEEMEPQT